MTTAMATKNPTGGKGVQFVIGFPSRARKAPGQGRSRVQSVLFDQGAWTPPQARAWLATHGFKRGKVDRTEDKLRFRQEEPGNFARFRTIAAGRNPERNPFVMSRTRVDTSVPRSTPLHPGGGSTAQGGAGNASAGHGDSSRGPGGRVTPAGPRSTPTHPGQGAGLEEVMFTGNASAGRGDSSRNPSGQPDLSFLPTNTRRTLAKVPGEHVRVVGRGEFNRILAAEPNWQIANIVATTRTGGLLRVRHQLAATFPQQDKLIVRETAGGVTTYRGWIRRRGPAFAANPAAAPRSSPSHPGDGAGFASVPPFQSRSTANAPRRDNTNANIQQTLLINDDTDPNSTLLANPGKLTPKQRNPEPWRYEDLEVVKHPHGWMIEGRWLLRPIGPFDTKANATKQMTAMQKDARVPKHKRNPRPARRNPADLPSASCPSCGATVLVPVGMKSGYCGNCGESIRVA